jgi:hypothetical protein
MASCAFAAGASAQTTESPQAPPVQLDNAHGAIAGSTRFIGLGGAFVAIADDSEGVAINPASVALRLPYSWSKWDYGFGVDFAIGSFLPKNDLYNRAGSNDAGKSSALFGSLAAIVYYDYVGVGVSAEAQSNAAGNQAQAQGINTDLAANFGVVHASLAYGFCDGQLLLGAGPRLVGMSFDSHSSGSGPLSTAGVGYEAGVVYKPTVQQYRLAAAVKSPINARVSAGVAEPSTVHVPWEMALGFAYQFGARALNPPFVTAADLARQTSAGRDPSKAELQRAQQELFDRYQRRQYWYLLVSAQLSLSESDGDHVGVERYWSGREDVAPQPVVSPRVGVETEVVPHRLRLRGGSYYESARRGISPARAHGTGGMDIKLFEWSMFGLLKPFDYFQLSLAADAARSYLNTSFSIGFWH